MQPTREKYFYPAYLTLITVAGIALIVGGLFQLPDPSLFPSFLLLILLGVVAESTATITLRGINFSVSSTVSVAAIPLFGPLPAALVAAASQIGLWVISLRTDNPSLKQALRRLGFNVGVMVVSIAAAGAVYQLLSAELRIAPFLDQLIIWIITIGIADQLNFWLVVGIVFLQHGASPLEIWHDQRWAIPINIAVTGFGGGILALAVQESGPLGVIIFFMPILLSAYSFRLYVKRTEEERTKLEELVELRTADLGAAKRELEQLHEEKDAFLAVLSHDMRSPLTNIHGYASLLMSQPDMSSEEREKMLRVVIRNEKALLEIVNNILELRQLQAGNQILLSKEPLNIALVIVESVENTIAFAKDKDIDLSYEIGDIEDPRPYFVMGDKGQLNRVVQNLISNAVKYTPSGGRVVIRACPNETEVLIEVEDTGYGIPKEDLPRIFDNFHRVEGHRGLAGGTGLGLAIVKNIINAHKGTITVESEVEKGSKFTVTIPR